MVWLPALRNLFVNFFGSRKRVCPRDTEDDFDESPSKRFRRSESTSPKERIIPIRLEHPLCNSHLPYKTPSYKKPMSSRSFGPRENYIEISDDDDDVVEVRQPARKARYTEPKKIVIENETSDDDVQIISPTNSNERPPKSNSSFNRSSHLNSKFSINHSFRLDDRLQYEYMLKSIAPNYGLGRNKTSSTLSSPKPSPSRSTVTKPIVQNNYVKNNIEDYIDLTKNENESENSINTSKINTPNATACFSSFASAVSSLSNSIEYDSLKLVDLTSDGSSQSQETDSDIEFVGTNDSSTSCTNSLRQKLNVNPICREQWIKEITEKHKNNITWKANLIREEEKLKDLHSKHNLKQFHKDLENRFRRSLIFDPPIDLIEDSDEESFPEFTKSQEAIIQKTLSIRSASEVIVQKFNMSITRGDIKTLEALNWLNDEIINFYMNLIMERSKLNPKRPKVYATNTFFYPKLISGGHASLHRWTKKVDIFAYDLMLVPIHLSVHWCMAVIDFRRKEIKYFDSMGRHNKACVNALLKYLVDERMDKKREKYPTNDWKLPVAEKIPQQMNGSDCGVFSCTFAEFESRSAPFKFSQKDMPYIRRKIIYEIVSGKLLLT